MAQHGGTLLPSQDRKIVYLIQVLGLRIREAKRGLDVTQKLHWLFLVLSICLRIIVSSFIILEFGSHFSRLVYHFF